MYRPSARAEIVAALLVAGGRIEDPSGRASAALIDALEEVGASRSQRNLSGLLSKMERDGIIERETGGRRTTLIALADDIETHWVKAAEGVLIDHGWTEYQVAQRCTEAGVYREAETATRGISNGMLGLPDLGDLASAEAATLARLLESERGARQAAERENAVLTERVEELEAEVGHLRELARLADQVSRLFTSSSGQPAASLEERRSQRDVG